MALLGYDGFDHLSTTPQADLVVKPFGPGCIWSGSIAGMTKVAGLIGGFAIQAGIGNAQPTVALPSIYTTLVLGFRYKTQTPVTTLSNICWFLDGATVQCGLATNAAGKLIFWRGTNATVIATGTTTLTSASWYMIEIKTTINNTTGTVDVKLNGIAETGLSGITGLNNRNSANNQATGFVLFVLGGTNNNFDDVYCLDTTGSAPYNDFLGIIRVETIYPTTNNSVTWTPNASTNVSQVLEINSDGDTTFNSATGAGLIDTFNHASLSSTPVSIYGVSVCVYNRKDDVSAQSIRTKLISGATTTNGATVPVNTAYQYTRDFYTADPNTAGAWTGANVNATKIGYEHI